MVRQTLLVTLAAFGLASSCDSGQQGSNSSGANIETGAEATWDGPGITVEHENLPALENQHYQAWVVVEGENVALGRFNIDNDEMIYLVDEQGEQLGGSETEIEPQGSEVQQEQVQVNEPREQEQFYQEQEQVQEREQVQEQVQEKEQGQELPEDTGGEDTGDTDGTDDDDTTDTVDYAPDHQQHFQLPSDITGAPERFMISVESNEETDVEEGTAILLSGEFDGNIAEARMDSEEALNTDFSDASGSFFIGPQNMEDNGSNQGVWFFNRDDESASLELPQLPEGWMYEAWVEHMESGEQISLGRFTPMTEGEGTTEEGGTEGEDTTGDGGTEEGGTNDGEAGTEEPAETGETETSSFPGQDFEALDRDFADGNHMVFITIEPAEGDTEDAFPLRILSREIPQDIGTYEMQELELDLTELPLMTGELFGMPEEEPAEDSEDTGDDTNTEDGNQEGESETTEPDNTEGDSENPDDTNEEETGSGDEIELVG